MINVPQIYYHKIILDYIDLLIMQGYTSYESLSEAAKSGLTCMCLDVIKHEGYYYIIEYHLEKTLRLLQNYLINNDEYHAKKLADSLKDSANRYTEDFLPELYEERVQRLKE